MARIKFLLRNYPDIFTWVSQKKLIELSKWLLANKGSKIFVDGHTDNIGSSKYNMRLAKRRTNSVLNLLILNGVDGLCCIVRTFGESRPTVSNTSPKNRAKNRRVEFILADQ